jgi:hypothetical protein
MRIEAGAVARINVSEHDGNHGRIVDVIGALNEKYWIVTDGAPFVGYAPWESIDTPFELRQRTEAGSLCIEAWKLQRVY